MSKSEQAMRYAVKIRNCDEKYTIQSRKRHSFLSATTIAALTILSNHHLEVVDSLSMKPSSKSSASRASSKRQRSRRDDDTTKPSNTPPPKHKIEFVNFWGSKIKTDDSDTTESIDPRIVPCVETLDLHDGPLPPGAYLQEGKPEFEAKSTCRIALNLQISNNNRKGSHQIDADETVRRLQKCIDAGFHTFQLQHQARQGMELMAKLRQETPSYVETYWSLRHRIPTSFGSGSPHQQQLETRHSILKLISQTGDTALDSLQLVHNPSSPYTLDVLDHLAELQRDGYIRSIGVKDMPRNLLKQARKAGLADLIDFQHQSGNLLLPASGDDCDDKLNMWMNNALVGSLLTGSRKEPLQITREEENVLNEWATRREAMDLDEDDEPTPFNLKQLFNMYQDEVVETLQWIALKHRVAATAVAIRWALECGSDGIVEDRDDTDALPPIVSSALIDCDLSMETFDGVPTEWRKVFRFQLDEEDKEMLQECSAPSLKQVERAEKLRQAKSTSSTEDHDANPEDALNDWERELMEYQRAMEESEESFEDEEYPEIDFSNQTLWL